ncbi:Demethylrebeccamycin-D-glucose O-methyltransferase [Crateriforma conspicua]|uniref:Demethylrebeccamycin-D-glucose O-methyltransferase n=1 Tax=Crateriforma conspicua TaxID=2527996 RepID=A0A5C6FQ95_9PLAN|nr:class I SAM-dependent methyltransferase [Crateriforma conspicua]TWU62633.1 Demethylrebeccamycin-D-glucose O-methyltransferase [Crateriforma conspicua]
MKEQAEPSMEMIFSFFEEVERKGSGGEASTLKALSLLTDLPTKPPIVEFGCGTGVASIPLARSLDCELTAVEIHQPFLDILEANAAKQGVGDRIKTVHADMREPPFPEKSFDVIWSEATIYNVGFEQGLRLWKPLLRAGGYIVVSEVAWLTQQPPQMASEFWNSDYPSMTTVNVNLATLRAVGFNPVDHFVLSPSEWQNYYGPLQEHVTAYRSSHAENRATQALADSLQNEIDMWKECGDSFGYCFFIGRAN